MVHLFIRDWNEIGMRTMYKQTTLMANILPASEYNTWIPS